MKVGDPRQAIVLSVVAVIIVAVAVFRAIPTGGTSTPQTAVALRTADSSPKKEVVQEESPTPIIDAFSHPNLSKSEIPVKSAASQTKPPKTSKSDVRDQIETDDGSLPPAGSSPAGIPGISQQTNGGAAVITVRLDAIVRSDTALAALTVAGNSVAPSKAGTTVNGHIKILKIEESSVVIEAMNRKYVLNVGEEVKL